MKAFLNYSKTQNSIAKKQSSRYEDNDNASNINNNNSSSNNNNIPFKFLSHNKCKSIFSEISKVDYLPDNTDNNNIENDSLNNISIINSNKNKEEFKRLSSYSNNMVKNIKNNNKNNNNSNINSNFNLYNNNTSNQHYGIYSNNKKIFSSVINIDEEIDEYDNNNVIYRNYNRSLVNTPKKSSCDISERYNDDNEDNEDNESRYINNMKCYTVNTESNEGNINTKNTSKLIFRNKHVNNNNNNNDTKDSLESNDEEDNKETAKIDYKKYSNFKDPISNANSNAKITSNIDINTNTTISKIGNNNSHLTSLNLLASNDKKMSHTYFTNTINTNSNTTYNNINHHSTLVNDTITNNTNNSVSLIKEEEVYWFAAYDKLLEEEELIDVLSTMNYNNNDSDGNNEGNIVYSNYCCNMDNLFNIKSRLAVIEGFSINIINSSNSLGLIWGVTNNNNNNNSNNNTITMNKIISNTGVERATINCNKNTNNCNNVDVLFCNMYLLTLKQIEFISSYLSKKHIYYNDNSSNINSSDKANDIQSILRVISPDQSYSINTSTKFISSEDNYSELLCLGYYLNNKIITFSNKIDTTNNEIKTNNIKYTDSNTKTNTNTNSNVSYLLNNNTYSNSNSNTNTNQKLSFSKASYLNWQVAKIIKIATSLTKVFKNNEKKYAIISRTKINDHKINADTNIKSKTKLGIIHTKSKTEIPRIELSYNNNINKIFMNSKGEYETEEYFYNYIYEIYKNWYKGVISYSNNSSNSNNNHNKDTEVNSNLKELFNKCCFRSINSNHGVEINMIKQENNYSLFLGEYNNYYKSNNDGNCNSKNKKNLKTNNIKNDSTNANIRKCNISNSNSNICNKNNHKNSNNNNNNNNHSNISNSLLSNTFNNINNNSITRKPLICHSTKNKTKSDNVFIIKRNNNFEEPSEILSCVDDVEEDQISSKDNNNDNDIDDNYNSKEKSKLYYTNNQYSYIDSNNIININNTFTNIRKNESNGNNSNNNNAYKDNILQTPPKRKYRKYYSSTIEELGMVNGKEY